MKSSPDSSALDIFIRETLKAPDINLPPVDWSEVEVLLRHEQKSISIGVNRKHIVYSVAGVIVLLLVFGIFKIAQYYSSLPPETESLPDSTQNTFNAVDTVKPPVTDFLTAKTDSVKPDSSGPAKNIKKSDSIHVALPLDTASAKKIIAAQKTDKKKKQSSVKDTTASKTELPPSHLADSISAPPPPEPKTEIQIIADTVNKSVPVPQNNSKKKKAKTKKVSNPPATEQPTPIPPAEIKSDSLKQQ
jgi:hypothetical protein